MQFCCKMFHLDKDTSVTMIAGIRPARLYQELFRPHRLSVIDRARRNESENQINH